MRIAVPFTELLQQLWCPSNVVALEPLGAIFIRRRHEKCPQENRSLNLPIIHVRMWRITSCRKLWRRFTGSRSLPGSYMTLWDESEQSLKRVACVCASLFCARVSVCLCFWGVCTSSIMWMPVVMLKLIMISQLTGGLCSFAPSSLLQSVSLLKWIKEKTQSLFRDSWASYTSTDYLLQSKALYTFSGDKLAM